MVEVGERVLFKSAPGTVRFLGNTEFSGGIWCGVELDTAAGKNDGSVQGVRYFECPPLCGIFVREPMLDPAEKADPKKRRQTSTGVRTASRASTGVVAPAEDGEATRLRSIVSRLQDKLQAMHAEMDSLKHSAATLQEQRAEAVLRSSRLEEDLEMASIDKETVEEQNELLKQEVSVLRKKNEALQSELDALKEELQLAGDVDVDELTTRNTVLEQALLKLKDHADDLQTQLERALIDANKNNELPKEVVLEHNKTKAKLAQYESKIKELEDLRKEEEDLEKIHMDTENEMQQEIKSLESIIAEKQSVIATLEQKNNDLSTILATLKKQSEREVTFDFKKFEEYKISTANLQREKQSLQLDFKILRLEVEMLEGILSLPPMNNDAIKIHRATGQLKKQAAIYQLLGDSVEVNTDDLYLSLLGTSVKFTLLQFSLFLEFVSTIQSDLSIVLELQELESLTEDFIHHIKEQELRNIPSLQEIQSNFLSQLDIPQTHFPNRFTLHHQSQQHRLSLQIIQQIISKINTKSLKTNSVEKIPELTRLYQSVLKRIEWIDSLIERVAKETKDSNEITNYEMDPLSNEVQSFVDGVLEILTSLEVDNDKMSLLKEFNTLIKVLDSLPVEFPTWGTSRVFISEDPSLSHDAQELQEQLVSAQLSLKEKSTSLEESTSKIQVLQARLEHLHDVEILSKKYRSEIETLTLTNQDLDIRVGELIQENEKIGNELHRARNNNLLYNSQFETLLEQKQYTEKASLVSEIEVLQRAVRHYTSKDTVGREWLRKELVLFRPFDQVTKVDELRKIGKDLQRAIERSHHHIINS